MAYILETELEDILTIFTKDTSPPSPANNFGLNKSWTKKEVACFSDEGSSRYIRIEEKEVRLTSSYLVEPKNKPSYDDMILKGTTAETDPIIAGAKHIADITEEYSIDSGKVTEGWSIWQK